GRALDVALAVDHANRAPRGAVLHGLGRERGHDRAGALDHGDGHARGDILPAAPAAEDLEIVAAHQPGEIELWEAALQRLERIDGVLRAQSALDVHHDDARVARYRPGVNDAVGERSQPGAAFERILRRHQPPHVVEAEALERDFTDVPMTFM